jgi:hypothetical protein
VLVLVIRLSNASRGKRYSLGTKSKSFLKYNPDGSLTLYFGAKSPGKDKESNWAVWYRPGSAQADCECHRVRLAVGNRNLDFGDAKLLGDLQGSVP